MTDSNRHGLPIFSKLMFYGLNGFFLEIVFNAAWYFFDPKYSHMGGGWKLHGSTSLWSFPMYGISIYILERISKVVKPHLVLPLRALVYVMWTYLWEYSCGYILRKFNACPWDYHDYTTYHLHGLITFDYAPLWFVAVVFCEMVTIRIAQNLSYVNNIDDTKCKSH